MLQRSAINFLIRNRLPARPSRRPVACKRTTGRVKRKAEGPRSGNGLGSLTRLIAAGAKGGGPEPDNGRMSVPVVRWRSGGSAGGTPRHQTQQHPAAGGTLSTLIDAAPTP